MENKQSMDISDHDFNAIIGEVPLETPVTEDDVKNMIENLEIANIEVTEPIDGAAQVPPVKSQIDRKAMLKAGRQIEKLKKAGYSSQEIIKAMITKTDPIKKKNDQVQLEKQKSLKKKKKKLADKSRQRNRS